MSRVFTLTLLMAAAVTTACGQRHYYAGGGYAGGGYSSGGYGYVEGGWGNAYGGYVRYAPPRPRYERYGRPPGPGYVWCDGYWDWRRDRWSWVGGSWRRPPSRGGAWVTGYWGQYGGRGYRWHPGRWR